YRNLLFSCSFLPMRRWLVGALLAVGLGLVLLLGLGRRLRFLLLLLTLFLNARRLRLQLPGFGQSLERLIDIVRAPLRLGQLVATLAAAARREVPVVALRLT